MGERLPFTPASTPDNNPGVKNAGVGFSNEPYWNA
jgi:hypothetical protein